MTETEAERGEPLPKPIVVLVVVAMLAGLGLRIAGARGDLWQDEIWTFDLLRRITSPLGIFLDMSADNNHFLNTLYLYIVGPDASTLAQRALSVLLGVATIGAAALVMRGRHWMAQAAAIVFAAGGYVFVHYGSEARGYAGLILFTLVSIHLLEREIAAPDRRNRLWLGLSNLAGTLFQPIMVGTVAVMIGWTLWIQWRQTRSIKTAFASTNRIFSATLRLLIAALLLAVIAVYRVGGYKILNSEPFTPGRFLDGYGGMLRFMLGIPDMVPAGLVLVAVVAAAMAVIALLRERLGHRASFYVLAIVGLPLALFCAQLPNLAIYRYYLLPAIALFLLSAETLAVAWSRGGALRLAGIAVAGLILAGNGGELAKFFEVGRGSFQAPLREIAASPSPTVTSNLDGVASTTLEFYERRLQMPIAYIGSQDLCRTPADWVIETTAYAENHPDQITIGDPACPRRYRKQSEYPYWGLSGWYWTLYRAAP